MCAQRCRCQPGYTVVVWHWDARATCTDIVFAPSITQSAGRMTPRDPNVVSTGALAVVFRVVGATSTTTGGDEQAIRTSVTPRRRQPCCVVGCEKLSACSGMCERHSYAAKKYGDPLYLVKKRRFRRCEVVGCIDKTFHQQSLCHRHYTIARTEIQHQRMMAIKAEGCFVCGCTDVAKLYFMNVGPLGWAEHKRRLAAHRSWKVIEAELANSVVTCARHRTPRVAQMARNRTSS